MKSEENTGKALVVSILSLSLLTVMAGAAVALTLGVIHNTLQTVPRYWCR